MKHEPNKFIAYLPLWIGIIFFVLLCCSCNVKKDLSKSKSENKRDSTIIEKTSNKINSITNTTVTESFSTSTITPEITNTSLFNDTDLNDGQEKVLQDNDAVKVTEQKDAKTGKKTITTIVKPQKVIIPGTRVSISQNTVNEVKQTDKSTKVKSDVKEQSKVLQKQVSGGINWNWLWLILVLALVFIGWRLGLFRQSR